MQLIQELPLVQQIATGAAVVLVFVLLLVAMRRRAAKASDKPAKAPKPSRQERKAEKKTVPRRKRRKLAAEAAHAMGTEATPGEIVVPPVEIAGPAVPEVAVEPVTAPEVELPTAVASDDPYVTGADTSYVTQAHVDEFDEDGVVVADPGWPAPGELATSFDPDAFDPVPAHDDYPQADSRYAIPTADEDEFTEPFELPDLALEEIELPHVPVPAVAEVYEDDEFDPASGWSDAESEPAVADVDAGWDEPAFVEPVAQSVEVENPVEIEQFWGEPDGEDWEEPAPVEILEAPPAPVVAEEAAMEAEPVDVAVATWVDEPEVAWDDAEPAAEFTDLSVPFPPPGTIPTHEVTEPTGWSPGSLQSGPVVLDLAGLAASGQALELVIEPNADGNGVRLRFGAPGTVGTEVVVPTPAAPVDTVDEIDPDLSVAEVAPAEEMQDVPFLTGGTIFDAAETPAFEAPAVDEIIAPDAPVIEADVPVVEPDPPVMEAPASAADPADAPIVDAPVAHVALPVYTAPDPVAEEPDDDEFQDDPAKILAEIRARLAELDARRHAHS